MSCANRYYSHTKCKQPNLLLSSVVFMWPVVPPAGDSTPNPVYGDVHGSSLVPFSLYSIAAQSPLPVKHPFVSALACALFRCGAGVF